jgi:hypothetical protein
VDRRTFVVTVAGGLLAAPLAAEAQGAGKVWLKEVPGSNPGLAAFSQACVSSVMLRAGI